MAEMTRRAHEAGAVVLVDGAQAVAHQAVDVQAIDCDFYAFSGHKLYGPTGIGALYGRAELLRHMPPWQGGGDMIRTVAFDNTTFAPPPQRFEAGTPNIAGAIALAAAIDYVQGVGLARIHAHEQALLEYGTRALQDIPGVRLVGTAREKAGILSFLVNGIHPHDLGTILDSGGRGDPRRAPLRDAPDDALRHPRHRARLARPVQRLRRPRRIGRLDPQGAEPCSDPRRHAPRESHMTDMQDSLRELYQEVIFDHNRNPRNYRPLPAASHHADGHNPLCGDQLTVYLQLEDGIVREASFVGHGCAISTASASLMTEAVKGKPVAEVEALFSDVHALLTEGREAADPARDFGKLEVLSGVKEFPARVKCATLAWHTLHNALVGEHETRTHRIDREDQIMGDHYGETDSRVLRRDCAAVSVPWGKAETLPKAPSRW